MPSFFKYSATIFIILAFGYILAIGKSLLLPLVIAIFIWYLIITIANAYENLVKLPSWISLVSALATIFLVFWLLGLIIDNNIEEVMKAAPSYQAKFQGLIEKIPPAWNIAEIPSFKELQEKINISKLVGSVASMFGNLASYTSAVLIYVLLLLAEYRIFGKKLKIIFSSGWKLKKIKNTLARIDADIKTYIKLKSLMSFVTAVLSYAALLLAGLDFAIFWALLIFLLNYIPTVGSIVAVIFPSLLALIQFGSFGGAFLIVLISLITIQIIVGNILEPKLMETSLNLSSLVIVLSLVVWGSIWGITGMFLCIPLMVIINIVLAKFSGTRSIAILMSSKGEVRD